MHPILIHTSFLTVYSYGAMLSLAFLAGTLVAVYYAKREGVQPETVLDVALWVILSAIVGARAFYVILFWHEFSGSLLEIIMIQHGGLVFYGGLVTSVLVIFWKVKRSGISLWKALDIASPAAAIGYSIARIGCFLNGCCYGIQTSVPWACKFPDLVGVRHPTQLYSSAAGLTIFLTVVWLWRKKRYEGQIFLETLILYAIYRFSIEFLREGQRYFHLSASQWISIVAFILALGALIWKMKKTK